MITNEEAVESPAITARSEWAVLGGLRFALALVVALAHISNACFRVTDDPWLLRVRSCGTAAVLGFFVVSGYSIAASIARDRESFARRRFLRIAPVFWTTLALALLPYAFTHGAFTLRSGEHAPPLTALQVFLNALCLQTIITPPVYTFHPSWSLLPEVIYYCFAPWFHRRTSRVLCAMAGVSAVSYILNARYSHWMQGHLLPALLLVWVWLAGFVMRRFRGRLLPMILAVFGIIGIFLCREYEAGYVRGFSWPVLVVFLATATVALAPAIPVSPRRSAILMWLGDISYPLYLIHFTVIVAVGLLFGHHLTGGAMPYLAASIAASAVIYALVDRPIRRIGRVSRKPVS